MFLQAVQIAPFDYGTRTLGPRSRHSQRMGTKFCQFVCESIVLCYLYVNVAVHGVELADPMIIASSPRLEEIGLSFCGMSLLVQLRGDFRDIWAR